MGDVVYTSAQIQKVENGFVVSVEDGADLWGVSGDRKRVRAIAKTLDEAYEFISSKIVS